ncbi:TatD family hydrolase [Actinotignum urinale]|uniref:TatD family hydrolase n=1 Tax=Actinotignum urinale TaxID=190146 RepID=UPI002A818B8F|nr:TatD family hydrolase [Actinotignum urinale]MDY5151881.1 TatD family hydrolase [Actinotignum urinale]
MGHSKRKKDRSQYPDIPEPLKVGVVDNHTHVNYSEGEIFPGDNPTFPPPMSAAEHARRMELSGIRHALTCACELPAICPTLDIVEAYPQAFSAVVGIHPNEAALHCGVTTVAADGLDTGLDEHHREYSLEDAIGVVADVARDSRVVAIGETGLDYFRTAEDGVAAQKASMRAHIALAKELDLPLQIHDREAHADIVEILRKDGAPERTVIHAFSGDAEFARLCAEHGWYGSFGGQLTYKANEFMREAFLAFPEDLILLETDAPYLTPVPWRGHPNAPYAAVWTARFGAKLRGMDEDTWCERLNRTTKDVYGI